MTRTIDSSLEPLRVVFDARPADACTTGIGRYARTVATVLRSVTTHACFVLGDDVRWRPRSPSEDELELPALLQRGSIDVYHSPLFKLPALLPCRAIVTIHDAIPAVRPDLAQPSFTRFFERTARAAVCRAAAVVCPSEHAKADVVRTLAISEDRVHVIPECPAPIFRELAPAEREPVLKRHGLTCERYLLVLGTLEDRKNPGCVLDALAQTDTHTAVFVGPDGGFDLASAARDRRLTRRVRRLGTVPDEDLVALLGGAAALVFPSRYEGFGLPVLEAFACHTPVVASNVTAIPEVAGDAALLFPPEDAAALADTLRRVEDLRPELVRRGAARLEQFSEARVRAGFERLYDHLATGGTK